MSCTFACRFVDRRIVCTAVSYKSMVDSQINTGTIMNFDMIATLTIFIVLLHIVVAPLHKILFPLHMYTMHHLCALSSYIQRK